MEYQNLEITPGIPETFEFVALDSTGIPYDLTFSSVKFEVFDLLDTLIVSKTFTQTATVVLTSSDTLGLSNGQYRYRVVLQSLPGPIPVEELFKGFLLVSGQVFNSSATPQNNVTVLSDGALYLTKPTLLVPGVWYAISSFFRFVVQGTGIVAIDGRDLRGSITGNLSSFIVPNPTSDIWYPSLGSNIEFRINNIVGSPSVQYLP